MQKSEVRACGGGGGWEVVMLVMLWKGQNDSPRKGGADL